MRYLQFRAIKNGSWNGPSNALRKFWRVRKVSAFIEFGAEMGVFGKNIQYALKENADVVGIEVSGCCSGWDIFRSRHVFPPFYDPVPCKVRFEFPNGAANIFHSFVLVVFKSISKVETKVICPRKLILQTSVARGRCIHEFGRDEMREDSNRPAVPLLYSVYPISFRICRQRENDK